LFKELYIEEKYDGYYVIVTSRHDTTDEWVIDTYKELWRIRLCKPWLLLVRKGVFHFLCAEFRLHV